jgi:hypothetical protein
MTTSCGPWGMDTVRALLSATNMGLLALGLHLFPRYFEAYVSF